MGALLFGATYTTTFPPIAALANLGSTILPALFEVDVWLSILLFVLVAVTLFYFLERHGEIRRDKLETGK
ncbi:MAG: hypothetical protein ACYC4L_21275 [Chloroflexota bacterium]